MARKRIKVPIISTKKMNKSFMLASSAEEAYKRRMNNRALFEYMLWKWKYRLQSDNTIRFRIVT